MGFARTTDGTAEATGEDHTPLQLELLLFDDAPTLPARPGSVHSPPSRPESADVPSDGMGVADLPSDGGELEAHWTESALLEHLRARGAAHLRRIVFRANRSTIWSLTRSGTSLNLHQGFRGAPVEIVDGFAVIATDWRAPTRAYRRAAERIRGWPGLAAAMRELHEAARSGGRAGRQRRGARERVRRPPPCAGTARQRRILRGAFDHFNRTRLGGLLPDDIGLRFSSRMTRRLGQMLGRVEGGTQGLTNAAGRTESGVESGIGREGDPVGRPHGAKMEIALSIDLLLNGNEGEFVETLLHEMAHAADFVERGKTDHGPHWKAWARRIGCAPRALTTAPVMRRSKGHAVPGVPPGLRAFAGPGDATGSGDGVDRPREDL